MMAGDRDEKFEQVGRLVRDGMEQRFRRDRLVVHVDGSKIKIEHPGEPGTFLSSISAELCAVRARRTREGAARWVRECGEAD